MLSEPMVNVPESWIPVFHRASLPGHRDNPDTDNVVQWPRTPGGIEYMPMSGRFIVRGRAADRPCEGGFIVIGEGGHPRWQADEPADPTPEGSSKR